MKAQFILALFLVLIAGQAVLAQDVWEDFDNPANVSYFFINGTSFNEEFPNPDTGGINSSALCAEYTRNGAVQYDVIVMDPAGALIVSNVSEYSGDPQTKFMTLDLYSPEPGITVQITLENSVLAGPTNYPAGRHSEYLATTTTTDEWETLTFELSNIPDASVGDDNVDRLVLLFDPGSFTSTVFVYDNLMGPEFFDPCGGVDPEPEILSDFECQQHINFTFSNGNLQNVENPNSTATNDSETVGRFQKWPPPTNDGAFGGSLLNPFSTDDYNVLDIQLYGPDAPQEFLVIFQDESNAELLSSTINTSNASDWETFNIDLSTIPTTATVANIVMLLDPSTDTEDVIFLDNLILMGDPSTTVDESSVNNVMIYPVPFGDVLKIASEETVVGLEVKDILGKTVFMDTDMSEEVISLDTSDWSNGSYVVTLTYADGGSIAKQIMK